MEFWEHRLGYPGISHIGGLSEECTYTFSIFVKLGESIFSALVESGRFFLVEVVDTNYWRHGYCLGLSAYIYVLCVSIVNHGHGYATV